MKEDKYAQYSLLFVGFFLIYGTILFAKASVEVEFISFIITTVIFGLARIDSRFLILPALLHLWLAPFMLMNDFKDIAETTAVYAYYYLVIGVLLQFIEFKFDIKNTIDLEATMKKILEINYIIPSIITIFILILNYFKPFMEIMTRNIYLYVLSVLVLLLIIKYGSFLDKNTNNAPTKAAKTATK